MYLFNRYVWLFNLFCFAKSNRPYYNSNLVIATEVNSTWISIVTIDIYKHGCVLIYNFLLVFHI